MCVCVCNHMRVKLRLGSTGHHIDFNGNEGGVLGQSQG